MLKRLPLLLACLLLVSLVTGGTGANGAAWAATNRAPAKMPLQEETLPPLDIMLGSMLMLGFHGITLAPDDPFLKAVAMGQVGHVILFETVVAPNEPKGPRNIVNRQQVATLTASLRKAAGARPMFIAIDQEGGQVSRLKPGHGFTFVPSAKAMGQKDPTTTGEIAQRLGKELAGVGINVDFAPVADVDANPDNPAIGKRGRSFSADAGQAAAHVQAFANGLAAAGVIPTLKHFPGQGCASADSHLGLTDISACFNGGRDLYPYAEAIRNGFKGMIMPGHLMHRGMDGNLPASLSKTVVTGLLRQGLGWRGVVVSDDLQMGAISQHYPLEESMRLAIEAGVDILLLGNMLTYDPNLHQRAFAALSGLVGSGQVSEERIGQSYRRIKALFGSLSAK